MNLSNILHLFILLIAMTANSIANDNKLDAVKSDAIWLSENGAVVLPFMVKLSKSSEIYESAMLGIHIDGFIVDGVAISPALHDLDLDNLNSRTLRVNSESFVYLVTLHQLVFASEKRNSEWVFDSYSVPHAKLIEVKYRLRTPGGLTNTQYLLKITIK